MKAFKAASIFLILSLLVFACSSTTAVKKQPQFRVEEITLAKGIDDTGSHDVLVNPTTIFSTQDSQIISHIKFENLSGKHDFRWEWYDPNGDLYYSTLNYPVEPASGKYAKEGTAWHKISLKGEKAQKYPGYWKVNIYVDNALIASKGFEIGPEHLLAIKSSLPKHKSYAVIVGISQYLHAGKSGLTNLPFADDDAQAFRDMLLALGWDDDHLRCLINKEATLRDIMISLGSWLTKARPDDLIVLYWSGHGFPDPENPENVYFACYDTDPRPPSSG